MADLDERSAMDRILDEGVRLFSARGFAGVSMTELASAAQVSKANIFHHFANKDVLYLAVLKHAIADFSAQLAELARTAPDFSERVSAFMIWHSRRLRERDAQTRLLLREMFGEGEHGPDIAREVFGEGQRRLLELVSAGQQAGHLRADVDPAVVALTLVAVDVFSFLAAPTLSAIPDLAFGADGTELARRVSNLILHGALRRDDPGAGREPAQPSNTGVLA
jgi:TetR/AcrR family transcriptional regulator